MSTRRIAVVTAGLSQPSSTRLLADRLAQAVSDDLMTRGVIAEVTVHELRDVAHDITNAMLTGFAPQALADVIDDVVDADALIAVTPVFTASVSGLFKSFFDVIEKDALAGKPVLIAATAGTARHSLVLDFALRPMFGYLQSVVVPTGVFAASEDWGGVDGVSGALQARVERAGAELGAVVADREPQVRTDPFALPTGSFEDLLGR